MRGSSNYKTQERSVGSATRQKNPKAKARRNGKGDNIIEQVEEEDKLSEDNAGHADLDADEEFIKKTIKVR